MYRPDPRIVRRLKEYDRDLDARWNRDRERWIITWRGKDAFAAVNDDGTYRPLDERAVTQAKVNDLWSHKSSRDYLRLMDEENHRMTRSARAKVMDNYRQMIVEEGHQKAFGVGQFSGWGAGVRA